jgi:hypothetical protein
MSSELTFLESAKTPTIRKSLENKNLFLIYEKIYFPYVNLYIIVLEMASKSKINQMLFQW